MRPHSPYYDFWAILEYITMITFTIDILLKFCLAYNDDELGVVRDHKQIAIHYCKFLFWVDLITTIPLDAIAIGGGDESKALYLAVIRWINLVRSRRCWPCVPAARSLAQPPVPLYW